uniref:Uncharacterized protein n=1 Tax=viral metagenome TaxID=1070528 RepID=A0A6C0CD42_9ZZZZ
MLNKIPFTIKYLYVIIPWNKKKKDHKFPKWVNLTVKIAKHWE